MALNKKALSRQGMSDRGAANHTCFYYYSTADALAVVLAAGYFNDVRNIFQVGDQISAVVGIGATMVSVEITIATVPDSGDVTVTAASVVLGQATIADISLAAVTGVDGSGSNAASKADVDARLSTIETAINAILANLEASGVNASA